MNTLRKFALILTLIAVVGVVPALAQESRTTTISEDQINESYRVTNPYRRSVSDLSVDLQPEQAVVSATITLRRQNPLDVVVTYTPYIENSRLFWTVEAVTSDGEAVSEQLLSQINAAISSSWRNYFRSTGKPGHVSAIEISDTELVITLN